MKKLNELIDLKENIDLEIDNLNDDSRNIKEKGLFFAIKGLTNDGNKYIESAIKNGAVAIVTEEDIEASIPVIKVNDVQMTYNNALNIFYNKPLDKIKIISVTGTDGKTTVAEIIYQLLNNYTKIGYIGTNGIKYKKFKMDNPHTTPLPDVLFSALNEFVNLGCEYVVMESSSERLATKKLDKINFDVSIFTNLSRDHLDTHKTMENYALAKAISFEQLKPDGLGIVNYDDSYKEYFITKCNGKCLTYSLKDSNADIYASHILVRYNRLEFDIDGIYGHHHVISHISGEFNVYNLMSAILCLKHLGYDTKSIIKNIALLKPIDARQLLIKTNFGFNIMIDYAHTANAFKNLYNYMKNTFSGRCIVVTGAPGGRDERRMIEMANYCTETVDYCYFTIDDARDSDPNYLLNLMVSETKKDNYELIIDRDEAIKKALMNAKKGDLVFVLGKGLEKYQLTKGKNVARPNDVESCKKVLKYLEKCNEKNVI